MKKINHSEQIKKKTVNKFYTKSLQLVRIALNVFFSRQGSKSEFQNIYYNYLEIFLLLLFKLKGSIMLNFKWTLYLWDTTIL